MSGKVFWITGLSGAGKTTLASLLVEFLKNKHENVIHLDGDDLREVLNVTNNHDQKSRLEIGMVYSRLSNLLAKQGYIVIVSAVALFDQIHSWNRKNIQEYFEIYLEVAIEELIKRDPKDIYANFKSGKISNVAGLDMKVDIPKKPDLLIRFEEGVSPQNELEMIINKLKL